MAPGSLESRLQRRDVSDIYYEMRDRFWPAALAAVLFAFARPDVASAGDPEEFSRVVVLPNDPNLMVVRYELNGNGMLYTADGGKTWKLMCDSMIGPGVTRFDPPVTMTRDGSVLVATSEGMWQDRAAGCGWGRPAELDGRAIGDVITDPSDPAIALAVTRNGAPGPNGMYRRDAAGTWSIMGTQDPALINRVRVVARGEGPRLYEHVVVPTPIDSDADAGAGELDYAQMIGVSDDLGATWRRSPLEVPPDTILRLEAVDPTQPDRIVMSILRTADPDSVMISSDQGTTFTKYLDVTQLGGIAVAPDGRVWIGDFGDKANHSSSKGIWAAANLDTAPTLLTGEYAVKCLTYQPATDTLYACQRWMMGTVDLGSGAFAELLSFWTVRDFVSCPGVDSAAVCKAQLCGAWCGKEHFSTAPVCGAYNEPYCGPAAPTPIPPQGIAATLPAAAASGSGGNAGVGDASRRTASDQGGCAIAPAGARRGGTGGQAALAVMCAIALILRRVRLGRARVRWKSWPSAP
jgi:hypothetical protein